VVNLRLAVNRRYKDRNQELKEEVCFINAVVWNKQAETCNQYLRKGSPVLVEGRLQSRSWEDASGQKRSVIEVRAERVQFLGSGAQAARAGQEPPAEEQVPELSTETTWLEDPSADRQESEDKLNEN
jgi:single-strand DNA-binding protein